MTEAEYFAWEYKKHCILTTGAFLIWSALCYDDKWDSIAFLVKTGQAPAVSVELVILLYLSCTSDVSKCPHQRIEMDPLQLWTSWLICSMFNICSIYYSK